VSKVAVIGGGISGLACAHFLRWNRPDLDVVVLEAKALPGGAIRTQQADGFVFDEGPSGFLNRHPSTIELASHLGLDDHLITGCEEKRKRFIYSQGRLRRFPDSPTTFVTSDLLSLRGKIRMLLEPAIPRSRHFVDESVGRFARRRLGREAADLLVDPVMAGIYAGNSATLSLHSTLPQIAAIDERQESLLMTILRSRRSNRPGQGASPAAVGTRRYVSFRQGMGALPRALAATLGDQLWTESPAIEVCADGKKWRVVVGGDHSNELLVDHVVSASPAMNTRRILSRVHPPLLELCESIPYAPVAVIGLGFREVDIPHPLNGFGYLVPSRERGSVLGVLWSTSIYPHARSPSGKVLMRIIVGGERDRMICDSDEKTLIDCAHAHLRRSMGIEAPPMFAKVARHPVGLPQYRVGHGQRVARIDAALRALPGLHIIGNAFRGIGISACTAAAQKTAQSIIESLEQTATSRRKGYLGPKTTHPSMTSDAAR
jgi:oxygen-dependent protoporphyrinogen oxidase